MSCSASKLLEELRAHGADYGAAEGVALSRQPLAYIQSAGDHYRSCGLPRQIAAERAGLQNRHIHPHTKTLLRDTFLKPAQTCARSRSCSDIETSRSPPSTLPFPAASQRNRQSARCPHVFFPRRAQAQFMSRPPLEMADVVRCAGQSFIEHSRRWINWQHRKVLLAIARCRTAALGDIAIAAPAADLRPGSPTTRCRNRHCPEDVRATRACAG